MPIPRTVEARPPLFFSDLVVATNLGLTQRDTSLNMREETGAGAANLSQVCAPAPDAFQRYGYPPTVVLVSNDFHLSHSREPLLRAAGFQVDMIRSGEFDARQLTGQHAVVFFCQTVGAEQASRFVKLLNQYANHVRTVRLTRNPQAEDASFDHTFQSPVAPAVLLCEMLKLRISIAGEEARGSFRYR